MRRSYPRTERAELRLDGGEAVGDSEQLAAGRAGVEAGGGVEGVEAGDEVGFETCQSLPGEGRCGSGH